MSNGGLGGWVVGLTQKIGAISPEKGAETSIYLASSPEVEGVSGKYFSSKKPIQSSPISYDQELAAKLWQRSRELVGLAEPQQVS